MGGRGAALHRQEEKAWQHFQLHKTQAAVSMYCTAAAQAFR